MLNVLLTFDIEVSPEIYDESLPDAARAIDRCIYGRTPQGEFGLRYQLETLDEHRLKGVFMVESLYAGCAGIDPLRDSVHAIRDAGQEVQLHVHTQWLDRIRPSPLPGRRGRNLRDFHRGEQALLVEAGLQNLARCGVDDVIAFRAGNFGADFTTLEVLGDLDIRFDSSHNADFLSSDCGLRTDRPMFTPAKFGTVYEFPVGAFRDRPGHLRPLQLCACSFAEMRSVLLQAAQRGWQHIVIVSHSFEFLNTRRDRLNPIVERRFRELCRFLADHGDSMRTIGFADVDPGAIANPGPAAPLTSAPWRTAARYVEQIAGRAYG